MNWTLRRLGFFIVPFFMIVLVSAAAAQKGERRKSGAAEAPAFKASENVDIDVATNLPATVAGALDADDSAYNRQYGSCLGLSATGSHVFYDTVTVTNNSPMVAALDVTTSDVGNPTACTTGDTFVAVYSPTFDPAAPEDGCVTSSDDGGVGLCSAVSFDLGAGETATIVVSSFANGAQFDYQVNVSLPRCSDGKIYGDGSFEGGLQGPMGTQTFEVSQRFDLPLIGASGAEVKRVCVCLARTVSTNDDFPLNVVVRSPNGAGTKPGARLHTAPFMAIDAPDAPSCGLFTVDLAGAQLTSQTVFIGVEWDQATYPELLIGEDTNGSSTQPAFYSTNNGGIWAKTTSLDSSYRNLGIAVAFAEPFTALSGSSGLLLPGYSIDLNDPSGPTTFLNVRNTSADTLDVNIAYHGDEVTSTPLRVDRVTLATNRLTVEDIRSDTAVLDPDGNGVASGLALVSRSDTNDATDLEGDFLNVDYGNDFASGDRLARIPNDLCNLVEIRFLDFGSGSRLTVIVDQPRGDVEPSFTYSVFNEVGSPIAGQEYYTNTHLNLIDAESLAGVDNHFGTVVFDLSKSGGGLVVGKYSAFGRFSVEMKGACRD